MDKFYAPRTIAHPDACPATKRKAQRALYQARYYRKQQAKLEARAYCVILNGPTKRLPGWHARNGFND